jgi:hypothetical protein
MFQPMSLRHPLRYLTLLFAAMNFAAPAAVSVADGAFARAVRHPDTHVEPSGANECTPPHAADCTVCRYLNGHGSSAPDRALAAVPSKPALVCPAAAACVGAITYDATQSRAPPAV